MDLKIFQQIFEKYCSIYGNAGLHGKVQFERQLLLILNEKLLLILNDKEKVLIFNLNDSQAFIQSLIYVAKYEI